MSVDELRKCIVASPFRPFTLNIADGRRIHVTGRDFILVPPEKGRTVLVYQRDGELDILDAMLITGVSFESAANISPSS
ncbi:MAG: hypothetical protein HYR84_13255 [Planctomycetes bacterium]|nr:hypothetical protein [Planctomycetota bacterium]